MSSNDMVVVLLDGVVSAFEFLRGLYNLSYIIDNQV
jgi:hypothetical protein